MGAALIIASIAFLSAGTMFLVLALSMLAHHHNKLLTYRFNHAIKVVEIENK